VPLLRRRRRAAAEERYEEGRVPTPFVELLDDDDLRRLNELLPWHCFTVDGKGRPFGRPAWEGKRADPQPIPEWRIPMFDERFGLAGKHVLEVGCFEGVHTIALADRAARVTAIDGRVENVVKTIVRCAFFDRHPTVFACDLESPQAPPELLRADLCAHIGVLYHLTDPVGHLRELGDWVGEGLMLDTHYALPEEVTGEYESQRATYRYKRWAEEREDPISGMREHAKWLLLDDLVEVLERAGFHGVEIAEQREERNGARVLLFAERSRGASAP
jgi:SAM-dependent methyltransferase